MIYLAIAWRTLHLVTWGRDCPNLPCDVVFDPEEWRAAWIVAHRCPPPETPPTLGSDGAPDRRLRRLSRGANTASSRPQSNLGRHAKFEPLPLPLRLPVPCMRGWMNYG